MFSYSFFEQNKNNLISVMQKYQLELHIQKKILRWEKLVAIDSLNWFCFINTTQQEWAICMMALFNYYDQNPFRFFFQI